MEKTLQPFIVLVGSTYYPAGWSDYVGAADTLQVAAEIAEREFSSEDRTLAWYEIIDLRIMEVVRARGDEDPAAYDPRSS